MKRRMSGKPTPSPKKARIAVPEYHASPSLKDETGGIIWPAPREQMENARRIIKQCAKDHKSTIILPDKDADGLSSGAILRKTLILLGLPAEMISTYLLPKGETVHSEITRATISKQSPSYIFILDQGSRPGPAMSTSAHTAMVIDHHFVSSDSDFPEGAHHVNACNSPPVATSALLTYEICKPLHPAVAEDCAWLCVVGTQGDLGNTLAWKPPFPDMAATFKVHKKKNIAGAISLLNAPRRTASFDVKSAWDALVQAETPAQLLTDKRLLEAREEVNAEVERCTHTAPKFSKDASVAVFRIDSKAQVHPVIATRWANHLSSKALCYVLVANTGYLPDKVNFSCRIARCALTREGEEDVDIIASLRALANSHPSGTLSERLGHDFARGHVQASGGIVGKDEFEELMEALGEGVKSEKSKDESPKKKETPKQKNTLTNYFGKA